MKFLVRTNLGVKSKYKNKYMDECRKTQHDGASLTTWETNLGTVRRLASAHLQPWEIPATNNWGKCKKMGKLNF